jgi:hypothetical protein
MTLTLSVGDVLVAGSVLGSAGAVIWGVGGKIARIAAMVEAHDAWLTRIEGKIDGLTQWDGHSERRR